LRGERDWQTSAGEKATELGIDRELKPFGYLEKEPILGMEQSPDVVSVHERDGSATTGAAHRQKTAGRALRLGLFNLESTVAALGALDERHGLTSEVVDHTQRLDRLPREVARLVGAARHDHNAAD
jgi:hypothetical protein